MPPRDAGEDRASPGSSVMSDVTQRLVLVLNRHWLAVHICTVRRALSLLYRGWAKVVTSDYQTYDFDGWRLLAEIEDEPGELLIRTPNFNIRAPRVIVLHQYQNLPPRTIRFNRRNIYLRDRHRCQYCGGRPPRDELTVDHVVPRSRGGSSVWENVVVACIRCNAIKGDRLPRECGMQPLAPPKRPSWMSAIRVIPDEAERLAWEPFVRASLAQAALAE